MFRRSTRPEDEPQPPCHAYREVERVLPPGYLVANEPPTQGRKLIVTSRVDGLTSYWEMDPSTARYVYETLRTEGRPVDCTSAQYDNR